MADNGTVGRVRTMMCTPANPLGQDNPAKDRLDELSKRYADHASGKAQLPPEESLWLRGEIDRLSQVVNPGQQNMWPDYSAAEKQYLGQKAAEQQRNANTLGMALLGPVFGAPMIYARALGAPEDTVEKFGEFGLDLASMVSLKGAGGRGRVIEPVRGRPVATARPLAEGVNGVVIQKPLSTMMNPRLLVSRQGPNEMSKSKVDRLAKKMKKNGFDPNSPIEVADADGKNVIIDGHHRTEAAIKAGIKEVPVNISTVPPSDAAILRAQAQDAAAERVLRSLP